MTARPRPPYPAEAKVDQATEGLPDDLRALVRKEAEWAAGHDGNSQACYAGG